MGKYEYWKVGDKVICSTICDRSIKTIKRLTKDLIILNNGKVFRKSDGVAPGYYYNYVPFIYKIATQEELEEEKRRNRFIKNIRDCLLEKLPTEELEKMYQIINK